MKLFIALILLLNFGSGIAKEEISAVDVQFYYGVGARNELDSTKGTFKKDMIADPPVTVPLLLSQDELLSIADKAESLGFFHMPTKVSITDSGCRQTPCEEYYLRITTHTVEGI